MFLYFYLFIYYLLSSDENICSSSSYQATLVCQFSTLLSVLLSVTEPHIRLANLMHQAPSTMKHITYVRKYTYYYIIRPPWRENPKFDFSPVVGSSPVTLTLPKHTSNKQQHKQVQATSEVFVNE